MLDLIVGTLALLCLALGAWWIRQARRRREDAALSKALRDPERWTEHMSDEEKERAERAALRERLKGGRR